MQLGELVGRDIRRARNREAPATGEAKLVAVIGCGLVGVPVLSRSPVSAAMQSCRSVSQAALSVGSAAHTLRLHRLVPISNELEADGTKASVAMAPACGDSTIGVVLVP